MASEETYQTRHERRPGVNDVLKAHWIACQVGNETLAKMLEAALVAVAMKYFDETFNAGPAY